nr:hypothetical protein [Streptomyces sp. Alain-F2R5]
MSRRNARLSVHGRRLRMSRSPAGPEPSLDAMSAVGPDRFRGAVTIGRPQRGGEDVAGPADV